MSLTKRFLFLVIALSLLLAGSVNAQSSDSALVRFAHLIPGAASIDIYINEQLAISNLDFQATTTHLSVPTGTHAVRVTPTGTSNTLWEQQIAVETDTVTTLVASSTSLLQFSAFAENLTPVSLGNARLAFIHAVAGGPAVDIMLEDGTVIAPNVNEGNFFGTFDVPTEVYNIAVTLAGETVENAIIPAQPFKLSSNVSYLAIVFGTADEPNITLLESATQGSGDNGFVQFAHGVENADPVDILVNGTLLIPAMEVAEMSPHLALPTGDHELVARVRGSDVDIVTATLTVNAGEASTVLVYSDGENVQASILSDDIAGITPTNARVNVLNAVPQSTNISLAVNDTPVVEAVTLGQNGTATDVSPTEQLLSIVFDFDGTTSSVNLPAQTLYGGVYYNVLAINGFPPQLGLGTTSLAQSLVSAPSGVTEVVTTNTTEQPVETTAPTESTEVVQTPPQTVVTNTGLPTARVLLDPNSNIQLRQYPASDSFSLGLAPSGSVFTVNGREGAPVFPEGQEPADGEEFIDPATVLEGEDDDLVPADTWINVNYTTPDGGVITAWVNAQFLEVRDDQGDLQRLADLPTVPGNDFGEAQNTTIVPPSAPTDQVSAVIFNLNPGVNLNIRRTPSTDGEVIGQVPVGTITEFRSVTTNREWAFISYLPPEGGSITGWVSTTYTRFEFNGGTADVEELLANGDISEVTEDDDVRGEVGAGTAPIQVPDSDPTRDAYIAEVILDQGANLHLRVNPNVDSESLDLIPSGTKVIISGRGFDNSGRDWLQVTFEGQSGWIFAAPISITFNSLLADITEVPLVEGFEESSSSTTDSSTATTDSTATGGIFIEYEDWQNQLPDDLRAASLAQAGIIIQVAQASNGFRSCGTYKNSSGQDFELFLTRIDFTAIAITAATDQLIEQQVFEGRPAIGCPDGGTTVDGPLNGLPPDFASASQWISSLPGICSARGLDC